MNASIIIICASFVSLFSCFYAFHDVLCCISSSYLSNFLFLPKFYSFLIDCLEFVNVYKLYAIWCFVILLWSPFFVVRYEYLLCYYLCISFTPKCILKLQSFYVPIFFFFSFLTCVKILDTYYIST